MDIEAMLDGLIAREGGYADHPADRGGSTMYGITEAVARAAGWTGAIRDLPLATARAVYRTRYWQAPGLDRVATRAPAVATALFDIGVNMSPAVAAAFLRRALNALNRSARDYPDLPPSGGVDAALLAALDGYLARRGRTGEGVLVKAVEALKGERYVRLAEERPANEAFVYGWLANRLG